MNLREIYDRLVTIKEQMEKDRLVHRKPYRGLCQLIDEIEESLATL